MSHMQAQMTKKIEWLGVDGPMGGEYLMLDDLTPDERSAARYFASTYKPRGGTVRGLPHPNKVIAKYIENTTVWSAEIVKGYGVRSSAPGYLDATPWAVYTSLKEARRAYAAEKRAVRGDDW
jgi:hypothetical protein